MKCIDYNNFKLDHHATDDCVALSKLGSINFPEFIPFLNTNAGIKNE